MTVFLEGVTEIIKLVTGFLSWILSPILDVLNFPAVPAELQSIIDQLFGYMADGMGILNFFCPLSMIRPALAVLVAVWAVEHGYHIVMWVLRKLPFVGVT